MEKYREIEQSIIKKFRKEIWSKFIKAIKNYHLINDNDKIAVCISGGKDSFLLAKCMQELKRHGQIDFDLKFIIMNPGYKEKVLNSIMDNLKLLNIDAKIFDTEIFSITSKMDNTCYFCAKMRRGYLYDYAKSIGCNKIALGHHLDDVVETILLNLIYNGSFSSMLPKLSSDHFEDMELIRPLYLIEEKNIIQWKEYNDLSFINCACTVTENFEGKRQEIKDLLVYLERFNKDIKKSLLTSSSNVNLNTIIAYKKDGKKYNKYE